MTPQLKRNTALYEFLTQEIVARLLMEFKDSTGHTFQIWGKDGKTFIVHLLSNGNGWEAYIPASEKNDVQATLDAVRNYVVNEEEADDDEAYAESLEQPHTGQTGDF